jgi:hypothetical protein
MGSYFLDIPSQFLRGFLDFLLQASDSLFNPLHFPLDAAPFELNDVENMSTMMVRDVFVC